MEAYGSTFQKLRKSKNFSLEKAAGTHLSVAQLSRFENGKSMLTLPQFFQCLANIHVSIEEFQFIQKNTFHHTFETVFQEIADLTNQKKYKELAILQKKILAQSQQQHDWHEILAMFIDSLVSLEHSQVPTELAGIKNYLLQVDTWGEFEIQLYVLFSFTFDVETTYLLMKTAIKRGRIYREIQQDEYLFFNILTNSFSIFLFNNQLDYAQETIQLFESLYAENTDFIGPHVEFLFAKGLLAFKEEALEQANLYCQQAISVCRILKQEKMATTLSTRYQHWLHHRHDENFNELTLNLNIFS